MGGSPDAEPHMAQFPSETYAARAKRGRPSKTFSLPADVVGALAARAAELGVAQSALVEEALRLFLAHGAEDFRPPPHLNAGANAVVAERVAAMTPAELRASFKKKPRRG